MLATYQAKIINNQLQWLDVPPNLEDADVIVTVLSKTSSSPTQPVTVKRQMPEILKDRGKMVGDIMDTSDMTSEWQFMND